MMTIVKEKKKLRRQMLSERAKLEKQEKERYDQCICQSIWETIHKHDFQTVHCYIPMGTEINISPLIEKMLNHNINVITPKTMPNRKLKNLILTSLNDLEKGMFGTCHPANSSEFMGEYDLIIVPGLAFNEANYRLGYGGGYYDDFMAQYPLAYKLGICYTFQKVAQIPLESHDVKLDDVLYE